MQRHTLLFTDSKGKVSVANIQSSLETVKERLRDEIQLIKDNHETETKKVNIVEGDNTSTVWIVETLPGYIYNSYVRSVYGVFSIVPVVATFTEPKENKPADVPKAESKIENTANPYGNVLRELSQRLETRRKNRIPLPPVPPNMVLVNRVPFHPRNSLAAELHAKLEQRRRHIEGY